jgi:hypothetical protein
MKYQSIFRILFIVHILFLLGWLGWEIQSVIELKRIANNHYSVTNVYYQNNIIGNRIYDPDPYLIRDFSICQVLFGVGAVVAYIWIIYVKHSFKEITFDALPEYLYFILYFVTYGILISFLIKGNYSNTNYNLINHWTVANHNCGNNQVSLKSPSGDLVCGDINKNNDWNPYNNRFMFVWYITVYVGIQILFITMEFGYRKIVEYQYKHQHITRDIETN